MSNMLISGGNGFLGSYLTDRALKEGYEVTIVDNLSTTKPKNLDKEVEFVKAGIENFTSTKRFDFYVHLAARPSPEDYVINPVETMLSNSVGTLKMLEMAKENNGIFLYTSSSEAYGSAEVTPTPEDYWGNVNFTGIRSCYDESKRFSEALSLSFFREFGLDVRIQRPFNVYGPGIREDGPYGRVIPRFIIQALNNEDITVLGDGKQTRSFLFVEDWVDATWKMLMLKVTGQVFNIGSPEEITITGLAQRIKGLVNSRSSIVFKNGRPDDPRRRAADITRALTTLKWEPKVSLEEGLKRTIGFFGRDR
ncbi:MAG: NAD-dependent epimerase/dehydratase family protein [Candidatus Thermoplasmatota archaeon]|nr:NAD-dependent epimerase/dehydratase family protein [Candidatus Thermoplasmatota archaeon]